MEPWEVTGDILKQRWRAARDKAPAVTILKPSDLRHLPSDLRRSLEKPSGGTIVLVHEMPEFNKAIMAYLQGDHTKLAEYLCSHHPISPAKQAEIAWALEERARTDKPGKGRRPTWKQMMNKMHLEALATKAEFFYRNWRNMNLERGISDWGHREEMRYQACELVVELDDHISPFADARAADAEAVMAQLRRPKSRRI
jgi:hypothetical protein